MLKIKPWWLNIFTPGYAWVTWLPCIYVPHGVDAFSWPEIIAHEKIHLRQQEEVGRWRYLWRYLTDADFRLDSEAEAMAVEILYLPGYLRHERLVICCSALCEDGGLYDPPFGDPAALTAHEAREAIFSWMEKLSPGSTHDLA